MHEGAALPAWVALAYLISGVSPSDRQPGSSGAIATKPPPSSGVSVLISISKL